MELSALLSSPYQPAEKVSQTQKLALSRQMQASSGDNIKTLFSLMPTVPSGLSADFLAKIEENKALMNPAVLDKALGIEKKDQTPIDVLNYERTPTEYEKTHPVDNILGNTLDITA